MHCHVWAQTHNLWILSSALYLCGSADFSNSWAIRMVPYLWKGGVAALTMAKKKKLIARLALTVTVEILITISFAKNSSEIRMVPIVSGGTFFFVAQFICQNGSTAKNWFCCLLAALINPFKEFTLWQNISKNKNEELYWTGMGLESLTSLLTDQCFYQLHKTPLEIRMVPIVSGDSTFFFLLLSSSVRMVVNISIHSHPFTSIAIVMAGQLLESIWIFQFTSIAIVMADH